MAACPHLYPYVTNYDTQTAQNLYTIFWNDYKSLCKIWASYLKPFKSYDKNKMGQFKSGPPVQIINKSSGGFVYW